MERLVNFRDRQEVQSSDLNNIGAFARESLDAIVRYGLTDANRYVGFVVSKVSATQVQVSSGRLFVKGAVHQRAGDTMIPLQAYLPVSTLRYVVIAARPTAVDTDVQPRDYLVDVSTESVEPQQVAMESKRYVEFQVISGVEGGAPKVPAVSTDLVPIATVKLSTTGVVDPIYRVPGAELVSVKRLEERAGSLETWRNAAGSRIETLATDLANLALKTRTTPQAPVIDRLAADVARLMELSSLPGEYSQYGSEFFFEPSFSDTAAAGYAAKIEEGLRFPDAAAASSALALFNPLESKVMVESDGFCLPNHTNRLLIIVGTPAYESDGVNLGSYSFTTETIQEQQMAVVRIRRGDSFIQNINTGAWAVANNYDYYTGVFDLEGRLYQVVDKNLNPLTGAAAADSVKANTVRVQRFWYDEELVSYQRAVTKEYDVAGAKVAQTFLCSQQAWATQIGIAIWKPANAAITLLLTEVRADGTPDPKAVIARATIQPADMIPYESGVPETYSYAPIKPTMLDAGKLYGVIVSSAAAHELATVLGSQYGSGTFFETTDGMFYQGTLDRDLGLRVKTAGFPATRTIVDLMSLSLPGGMTDIDIFTEALQPKGTSLVFQVRPDGTNTWYNLTSDGDLPFVGQPVLVHFRAVFTGTTDMAPGFRLTGSRVKVSRPATALTWISKNFATEVWTRTFEVHVIVDNFDPDSHDINVLLTDVAHAVVDIDPASVLVRNLRNYGNGHYRQKHIFRWTEAEIATATNGFKIKVVGAAAAATDVFHVDQLIWLAF